MVECPSLAKGSKFAALLVGDCFLIKIGGFFKTLDSRMIETESPPFEDRPAEVLKLEPLY
jgi:hypothetical protein